MKWLEENCIWFFVDLETFSTKGDLVDTDKEWHIGKKTLCHYKNVQKY